MDAYELKPEPLFTNDQTPVKIYSARSKALNDEVIIKRYECEDITAVQRRVLEAFVQTRVEHPHSCRLIEPIVEYVKGRHFVSLVMEKLSSDVSKELEAKRKAREVYTEEELRKFLDQVGQALAFAHAKGIAHRDLKPDNVFLDKHGNYVLGDYGEFWQKQGRVDTCSHAGAIAYTSPQSRCIIGGQNIRFNPLLSDVYSLGITVLHMASREFRDNLNLIPDHDLHMAEALARLQCSELLKGLLRRMLLLDENQRPSIEEVLRQLHYEPRAPPTRQWNLSQAAPTRARFVPMPESVAAKAALQKRGPFPARDEESSLTKREAVVANNGVYLGQWNGREQRHGFGKQVWENGNSYEGGWKYDNMHGRGRHVWADGRIYEGDWANGTRHGFGREDFPNGNIYIGQYLNDRKHGIGFKFYGEEPRQGDVYIGEFEEDERKGRGCYYFRTGEMHVGYYSASVESGKGVRSLPRGAMCCGDFEDGKLNGQAMYTHADGRVYKGQFRNGSADGRGKLTIPGDWYEGEWADDNFHGEGAYHSSSTNRTERGTYNYGRKLD